MKSVVKSVLFTPPTAILTPLRVLIPVISHFDVLDFKPKNWEKMLKVFTTSPIGFSFFKKNVVSLVYVE